MCDMAKEKFCEKKTKEKMYKMLDLCRSFDELMQAEYNHECGFNDTEIELLTIFVLHKLPAIVPAIPIVEARIKYIETQTGRITDPDLKKRIEFNKLVLHDAKEILSKGNAVFDKIKDPELSDVN